MIKKNYFFICLLFLLTPIFAWSDIPESYKNLSKTYNYNKENYSFIVKNLSNKNEPIVAYNKEKLFNPASVAKILTTYIALDELGSNFRWRSDFLYSGDIVGDTLSGDIIFKGRGDASFTSVDLEGLVRKIQRNGILNIEGDLILDKSYFSPVRQIKDFDNEPHRAYNVLPNPIVIQSNTVNFKLKVDNKAIKIEPTPDLRSLKIKTNIQLSKDQCNSWKSKLNYTKKSIGDKDTVTFLGSFSKKCILKELDLSIIDDTKYFYMLFKDIWKKNGGRFNGTFQVTNVEELNGHLLMSHFSRPLSELIRDINKFSLNLMARNLFLTILAEQNNILVVESNVDKFLKDWLNKNGIDPKGIFFENGAGLSRKTKISAEQLLGVMEKIYNDPLMPEMIASFPIVATDGTLKKRMLFSHTKRNGHFKTGSLKNVNAIAGYFVDKNKNKKIFIFMMNDLKANQSESFQQDLIDLSFSTN